MQGGKGCAAATRRRVFGFHFYFEPGLDLSLGPCAPQMLPQNGLLAGRVLGVGASARGACRVGTEVLSPVGFRKRGGARDSGWGGQSSRDRVGGGMCAGFASRAGVWCRSRGMARLGGSGWADGGVSGWAIAGNKCGAGLGCRGPAAARLGGARAVDAPRRDLWVWAPRALGGAARPHPLPVISLGG